MNILTSINIHSCKNKEILLDLYSKIVPYYERNYQVFKQEQGKILILKKKKHSTNFSENNRSILRVFHRIEIELDKSKSNLLIRFNLSYLNVFSIIVFIIANFFGFIYGYNTVQSLITLNLLVLIFLLLYSLSRFRKHVQFIKKMLQEGLK